MDEVFRVSWRIPYGTVVWKEEFFASFAEGKYFRDGLANAILLLRSDGTPDNYIKPVERVKLRKEDMHES